MDRGADERVGDTRLLKTAGPNPDCPKCKSDMTFWEFVFGRWACLACFHHWLR